MGQACCIANESSAVSNTQGTAFNDWKSTVKAILEFEEKYKLVHRWREFEVLLLQVITLLKCSY